MLLSASQKNNGGSSQDVRANYNDGDLGVLLGAGLHYRLGKGRWFISDVRFHRGLSDITKGTSTINNGVLSLNLGITFPLGNY
jgi:hypothetical protein